MVLPLKVLLFVSQTAGEDLRKIGFPTGGSYTAKKEDPHLHSSQDPFSSQSFLTHHLMGSSLNKKIATEKSVAILPVLLVVLIIPLSKYSDN